MGRSHLMPLTALAAAVAAAAPASAGVSTGHSGWQWGNPAPQGNTLSSIEFAGSRGYAAGAFGTLLRTDDGGATWTGIPTGITSELRRIRVIDADSLVIGGGCALRRSDDAGRTFRRLPLSAGDASCPSELLSFSFPSPAVGYVLLADGSVFATTDAGQTFAGRTAVPGGAGGAQDLGFTSGTAGLAVTSGRIFRTADGAGSWTEVAGSADAAGGLRSLTMVTAEVGYAVGMHNTVLKTTDGGRTFARVPVAGDLPKRTLTAIRCADPSTCLVATAEGDRLLRTTDGGATFTALTPATERILAGGFASPSRVVAVGESGSTVVSDDAGSTFARVGGAIPASSWFSRLRAATGSVAYAAGSNGHIARTTSGGASWEVLRSATSRLLVDVAFPTATTGYALDRDGRLQRTDNGGRSWKMLDTGTDGRPNAVVASSASRVLLIGPRGVRRSHDGGGGFAPIPGLSRLGLFDGDRTGSFVYAYGARALVASTDGGRRWRRLKLPTPRTRLRAVDFAGADRAYAIDTSGRVWRTRNRGRRWRELPAIGNDTGYDVSFRGRDRGSVAVFSYGGMERGHVLRTDDGGRSWRPQLLGPAAIAGFGLDSAGGRDFALAGQRSLLHATGSGDVGRPSALSLTAAQRSISRRRLRRQGGRVELRVALAGAGGGEEVTVAGREHGSSEWRHATVDVRSAGRVSLRWRLRRTTTFVAQWPGDADAAGDGTTPITVRVTR